MRARSGSERGKAGTASRADPSGSGPSQAGPTHAGAATSPESAERHARLLRLERLARNLDSALRLPGTPIRFGWDSIVGIIPGVGDTVMLLPALWIVMEGWRMGVRKRALSRMAFNTGADWLMGSVPLLGDIFDIGWKGNLRNVAVIRRELEREMGRSSRR
ncbi:DUF4112 domain-containing protein [Pseudooceanicola sediminis]|uniref:DUF4112 domain-containing protein n=1 Tax=Pseudooceanicola sediminis TaxID=2211117 RepID=UPI001F402F26|nr:DUF4112 domain-containing protein [Pseudooceanicola sediminis]